MRVFHKLDDLSPLLKKSAVAIGNFDGCHLGHQSLIQSMVSHAESHHLEPALLTFYPHPVEVLQPSKKLRRLMTTSEKLSFLQSLGVKWILVASFDEQLHHLSPENFFAHYLIKGLHAESVHVGYNFKFGYQKAGDTDLLKRLCEQSSIHCDILPPQTFEGQPIHSTLIRKLLLDGEVNLARQMMGHPYQISGQVRRGEQRGRVIGFPTANLQVPAEKLVPKNGVYLTRAEWQQQSFLSVTNVGIRPTFNEPTAESSPVIEVHLIGFQPQRLYDEFLQVTFLEYLREERKFDSIELLKNQIRSDIEYVKQKEKIIV